MLQATGGRIAGNILAGVVGLDSGPTLLMMFIEPYKPGLSRGVSAEDFD